MEQRSLLMSVLGVGVGVGLGIGLASGQAVGKWAAPAGSSSDGVTEEAVEAELRRRVVDGRETKVTFDEFPYYLSEQTRVILTSAAYVYLKQTDVLKYTRNLTPASRAILLSGPTELYQQMLAKALAHCYEAKLLLLDVTEFSIKIQNKCGGCNKDMFVKRSMSEATLERLSGILGSLSTILRMEESEGMFRRQSSSMEPRQRRSDSANSTNELPKTASFSADMCGLTSQHGSRNMVTPKRSSCWSFDEKILIHSLYKEVDYIVAIVQKMLTKLSGHVIILGSRLSEPDNCCKDVDARLTTLFPYNIEIKPPEDENHLVSWKSQLEKDTKTIQIQDNRNHITEVLAANDLECDDLGTICLSDILVLSTYIEEIVVSAVSYHLMNNKDPQYRNGKLVITSKSLSHGLSIFQDSRLCGKDTLKLEASAESEEDANEDARTATKPENNGEALLPGNKSETEKSTTLVKDGETLTPTKVPEVAPDNEFEKRIRPEVIPANEIGVRFDDIGALDEIKESLQELIILPLQRPDLFKGLLKPCRGILLFGPPGTGKTMLAKAIANEAGASFINVSMSTITSKWFGEDEKHVRALFTLAAKVAPTIIFVDEVDGMLGQRTRVGEHEAMRKIKNEFMTRWDGLLTKPGERILVLAATNRPFDLDEAIIRRFERRIMVGLPSLESRESILRKLLSKEKVEGLDYKELATMTEGYSGSDLKNLCITAAYRPLRELIQRERSKELGKKQETEEGESTSAGSGNRDEDDEPAITLRPLNMDDLKQAKNQVAASFAAEGSVMNELKQWNDLYGDGGSRKRQQLTYFL
ncbi:AAA-type ATPase family protein [Musa troglodytarum]|uniref:AAA-type ATPase family protein n=1 Tax=Musa troglodytarum TaxID=320322 RepID=A0A9E7H2P7_9LILI|nr:AAA-type ATPase family protein [Musa troglodytarum]